MSIHQYIAISHLFIYYKAADRITEWRVGCIARFKIS